MIFTLWQTSQFHIATKEALLALLLPSPCRYACSMTHEYSHSVPEEENFSRLDAFVSRILGCGVRAAKRLILEGSVLVNGRARSAQYKLASGALVAIRYDDAETFPSPPILAATTKDYCAFVKPTGLHTARILGSGFPSLEQTVASWITSKRSSRISVDTIAVPPELLDVLGGPCPGQDPSSEALPSAPPILLSRLDAATSGLVAAAFTAEAEKRFRDLESAGKVDKYYLALVHGIVPGPLRVTNALDTDSRKKTRVLAQNSPDPARHSEIFPLSEQGNVAKVDFHNKTTFVAVHIKRGARHQIRAHLAHAGFPLVGDVLYGSDEVKTPFLLHHTRLLLPGFSAFYPPSWLPAL